MPKTHPKPAHIIHFRLTNGGYELICTRCRATYFSGSLHTPAAFEAIKAAFTEIHKGCKDLTTRPLREEGKIE